MFAKISKKVVAVALVATMAVTTAAVASDDTASAAMKKKASVMQGKEVKLTASGSATWSSSNDNIAHCQKTKGKSIKVLGYQKRYRNNHSNCRQERNRHVKYLLKMQRRVQ